MKTREGYFCIDHKNSPGLTAQDYISAGLPVPDLIVGEGKIFEAAILKCCHCGQQYVRNPVRERPRGHCHHCDDYVCDNCEGKPCTSLKKTFDFIQEQNFRCDSGYTPLIIPGDISPIVNLN